MEDNNDYLLAIPAFIVGLLLFPILCSFQEKYNEILLGIILITILVERVASKKRLLVLIELNIVGFIGGFATFGGILTGIIGIPIVILWMLFINLWTKISYIDIVRKKYSVNNYK